MGKLRVTDFYFYRWRYLLGAIALVGALISLLAIAGFYTPGGLADTEMESATTSIHTPVSVLGGNEASFIINLPYHILQKLSVQALGVTTFSIKLPSLIMAGISILLLYGIVRLWFRRNVAIITSTIAVTSAQFLLLAQLGTPEVGYIFWSAAVLFSASMLAYSEKYRIAWMVVTSVLAALSLYAPFGIYTLLVLLIAACVHPHARFIVFSQPKPVLAACVALFSVVATPLILTIAQHPNLLLTLTGLSAAVLPSLTNVIASTSPYIAFYAPEGGLALQPVYGLATLLIAVLGGVRLLSAKYTAKSYIISLTFFFVFIGIITGALPVAYTFIPMLLLVSFGINYLIASWYKLFPLNPYARVAGLLPLAILVIGIAFSEFDRYLYTYHYVPTSRAVFTKDLELLDQLITKHDSGRITFLVNPKHASFYRDYASRLQNSSRVSITSSQAVAVEKSANEIIITSHKLRSQTIEPSMIAVTSQSESSARFYLYKNGYR